MVPPPGKAKNKARSSKQSPRQIIFCLEDGASNDGNNTQAQMSQIRCNSKSYIAKAAPGFEDNIENPKPKPRIHGAASIAEPSSQALLNKMTKPANVETKYRFINNPG